MGAVLCAMGILERINRLCRSSLSDAQKPASILSCKIKKYIAGFTPREYLTGRRYENRH